LTGISAARSDVVLGEAVELVQRLLTREAATHAGSTVRLDGGRLNSIATGWVKGGGPRITAWRS